MKTLKINTENGLTLTGLDEEIKITLQQIKQYEISGFKITEGMHIMDIGANHGFYTVQCAHKGAIVYAFEPSKKNYSLIKYNIRKNMLTTSVRTFNVAVSDKDGFKALYIPLRDNTNQYLSTMISTSKSFIEANRKIRHYDEEVVQAISLNRFMNEADIDKWDLVKIDCEGSEYEIIASLSKTNLMKIDRIVMETHIGYNENVLVENLKSANFKIIYHKKLKEKGTGFIKAIRTKVIMEMAILDKIRLYVSCTRYYPQIFRIK